MSETEEPLPPTHDDAIEKLVKTLINGEVAESKDAFGKTPQEKLRSHMKNRADATVMGSIVGLSQWLQARAALRQAAALESLARTSSAQALTSSSTADAQALIDDRESKRDYLATTYSLPTETLSLLWAMRGMVMDAAIRSLSRPQTFEPYVRVTTEEMAWSLRMTPEVFWESLPSKPDGKIDFRLLEEWGVFCYGGTSDYPDDWMFGG